MNPKIINLLKDPILLIQHQILLWHPHLGRISQDRINSLNQTFFYTLADFFRPNMPDLEALSFYTLTEAHFYAAY